jgi:1,4-alpha-glucan branching enzyme
VISFIRNSTAGGRSLICICNFSGAAKRGYRIGLPVPGRYDEILNTDSVFYGGGGLGNLGGVTAEARPCHGRDYSAEFTLPPLATIWLRVPA